MPLARRWSLVLLACCVAFSAANATVADPGEPEVVGTFPENEADIVRLADGALKIFYNQRGEYVGSLSSRDDGRTWSEPKKEFDVTGKTAHAMQALVDQSGGLQLFYLVIEGNGRKLGSDLFLDLWRATASGKGVWTDPRMAHHAAIGALRGVVQMKSGRIVIPFSTASPDRKAGPPIGYFYTTAITSDDNGNSWQQSPAELTAPCFDGYNGGNYGAVEPTIVQLDDGRLWMLIRTQTGRSYESFSKDGAKWSKAVPSRFYSSNSPSMLRRLDDGRLLLVWNNAQVQPRHEGQGVYGGRDALHAAVSNDDGRTWRGFREVYRDPTRHGPSDLRNDRGTAYPDAVQAADGTIVLVTGQGEGRRAIVRFSPEWLTATHRDDDFSHGLDGWIAFQEIGPVQRFWRGRRLGAQLVAHPDQSSRQVLSIARRDEEPGAGAVWNFPNGKRGTLTLRVRATKDFGGAAIALTDRLCHPDDDAATKEGLFLLSLAPGGELKPEVWHEVRFKWDTDQRRCEVTIDGQAKTLAMRDVPTLGVSYLALRSTAAAVDPTGLLVERVTADVEP